MNWLQDKNTIDGIIQLTLLATFFGVPALAVIVLIIVAAVKELRK